MAKYIKKLMTSELAALARDAESCILVDFRGLTAKESDDLRRRLRERGIRMNVISNKLFGRSLVEQFSEFGETNALAEALRGPTAVVFGGDGAITAAKALIEWRRSHEKLKIKGALFGRRVLGADGVAEISTLPTREVVISQVIGLIAEPIQGILRALDGVARNLVTAVDAIVRKREDAEKQGSEQKTAEQ
jgi:large subunit ribosomal protein L10